MAHYADEDENDMAALASQPVPAVAVKGLEWTGPNVNGEYHTKRSLRSLVAYSMYPRMNGFWLTEIGIPVDNLEQGYEAAQANYEARIRSTLAPATQAVCEMSGRTDEMMDRQWCEGMKTAARILDACVDITTWPTKSQERYRAALSDIDRRVALVQDAIIDHRKARKTSPLPATEAEAVKPEPEQARDKLRLWFSAI
ncbi:MAG: hypothetical protein E5Y67_15280 [Mesorhizobium sp.]|uniref:hypothetical protein n=1 Tax=Mesorhizobium sp. TaxID=1871066 RepID=UPI0011F645EF|nr:hypothetical protein [Mesorhizobium sp.]TIM13841.1 MAG: hypothetical protein E5Y67_15280 [Mesorhizobium sp.]